MEHFGQSGGAQFFSGIYIIVHQHSTAVQHVTLVYLICKVRLLYAGIESKLVNVGS